LPIHLTWIDSVTGIFYQQDVTLPRIDVNGIHTLPVYANINGMGEGEHTIRVVAEVNDLMHMVTAWNEITVKVENSRPVVQIHQPAEGAKFCHGESITFRGSAIDLGDIRIGIPDDKFLWISDLQGWINIGPTITTNGLAVGRHRITLQVKDSGGLIGDASRNITILPENDAQCSNYKPTINITQPRDGIKLSPEGQDARGKYVTVTLVAEAHDREDPDDQLTVKWFSDIGGELGEGRTITVKLYASGTTTTHTITAIVTDTTGNSNQDQIRITIEIFI
jgi:hypothetical protein